MESFGQSEPLTRRLKNILQLYAEGLSIFHEIIQNADDSLAKKVVFLLDYDSYSSASLFSKELANQQNAALLVYNDQIFTAKDFKAIKEIGSASKLDELKSTGKFGLGFNSVYHFTDTPMIYSDNNLVIFDPHLKYLPLNLTREPGIKIKMNPDIQSKYMDQFIPFYIFKEFLIIMIIRLN